MSIGHYFKPSILVMVLFAVLFLFFSTVIGNPYLFSLCDPCGCPDSLGWPIHFAEDRAVGPIPDEDLCAPVELFWNIPYLLIDALLWLVVAVGLVGGCRVVRNRQRNI